MKEIEVTTTSKVKKYQAVDGEIFTSKEECEKYENSARCVLLSKFEKLIVSKKHDAWSLMGGYDDHRVIAIKLNNKEDRDAFLQFYYLENPYYQASDRENYRKELEDKLDKALKTKDLILVGINCDNDYYFINTRQNIIDNLMNIEKE